MSIFRNSENISLTGLLIKFCKVKCVIRSLNFDKLSVGWHYFLPNLLTAFLILKTIFITFQFYFGNVHFPLFHSRQILETEKIFRLPSVSGNESWQNSELFELFIVEIFLQTEKTWIFVFTAMCCASSVSSLTQGCLRLHATFQKFWRNFCYRSIFAQSVARRLVFVIGLKFRQSIYFASNRNIFLSEKFADQKSTRKSASNHVHVTKMPELSHLNLFTSNPNAQNAENSASQIKTENSENSSN